MNDPQLIAGDCLEVMRGMPDDSVDLVLCSPPYEDVRTYGVDFRLKGQEWVNWAVERYIECCRVSRGLVAWVVEGKTRKFQWSATPALLMTDLHRAGVKLRKPPIYYRVGVPGSGGPDYWRNDFEFVVCSSKGRLPWSANTATGKPTVYDEGGACSNRTRTGYRVNQEQRKLVGSHRAERQAGRAYAKPKSGIANPGNVIRCHGGGGHLGSKLCHENEAPYPEALVEPFIRCFCPPDGTVLDPFCGSGTTIAVALRFGRNAIGIDQRESQIELTRRRIGEVYQSMAGRLFDDSGEAIRGRLR